MQAWLGYSNEQIASIETPVVTEDAVDQSLSRARMKLQAASRASIFVRCLNERVLELGKIGDPFLFEFPLEKALK